MDHNEFQLDEDLIEPFKDFLAKLVEFNPSTTIDNDDKDSDS